jgi:hypothetical protein
VRLEEEGSRAEPAPKSGGEQSSRVQARAGDVDELGHVVSFALALTAAF